MRTSKWKEFKKGDVLNGFELNTDAYPPEDGKGHWYASFICKCGDPFTATLNNVSRERTRGCKECAKLPAILAKRKFENLNRDLYRIWKAMNSRCKKENYPYYKHYGGRGITVCERWCDYDNKGFDNFVKDMGVRPSCKYSIDRIDNDKGYTPENCRWATQKEQMNNIRTNHIIEYEGKVYTLQLLAEKFNIKSNTLLYRLKRGWLLEEALIGKRDHPWKRPYNDTLSDEDFNTMLVMFFRDQKTLRYISGVFNISESNLSRVVRREDVVAYYEGLYG